MCSNKFYFKQIVLNHHVLDKKTYSAYNLTLLWLAHQNEEEEN